MVVCTPPPHHVDRALQACRRAPRCSSRSHWRRRSPSADRLVEAAARAGRRLRREPGVRAGRQQRPRTGRHARSASAAPPRGARRCSRGPPGAASSTGGVGRRRRCSTSACTRWPWLLMAALTRPPVSRPCGAAGGARTAGRRHGDRRPRSTRVSRLAWSLDGVAADAPIWDLQAASRVGVVRLDLLPRVQLERNGDEVTFAAPPDGVPAPLVELGYWPARDVRGRRGHAGRQRSVPPSGGAVLEWSAVRTPLPGEASPSSFRSPDRGTGRRCSCGEA